MSNKFPVQFILGLKDQATEAFSAVEKKFGDLESKAVGFNRRMQRIGEGFEKVGKRMSLALTAPIAAFAGFGVKESAELQGKLADIGNLFENGLGESELNKRLETVRKSIEDISVQTGASTENIAESFKQVIDAGFNVSESMQIVAASTKLATIEGTQLETTSKSLTKVLSQFKIPADQVENLAGKVRMLSEQAKDIPAGELFAGIESLAPKAKDLGVSMDELFAALAQATDILPAGEAISALDNVLNSFSQITPKAAAEAKRLGLDFGRTALKTKGLSGVLEDISKNGSKVETTFNRLFKSKEAALLFKGLATRNLKEFNENVKQLGDKSGVAANFQDDLQRRLGGLDNLMLRLSKAFKRFQVTAVEPLVKFLEAKLPSVISGFEKLNAIFEDNEWLRQIVFWTGAILAVLGPLALAIGTVVKVWGLATVGWIAATKWLTGIAAALDTIVIAFTGISAFTWGILILGALGWYRAITKLAEGWGSLWASTKDFFTNWDGGISSKFMAFFDFLNKIVPEVLLELNNLFGLTPPKWLENLARNGLFGGGGGAQETGKNFQPSYSPSSNASQPPAPSSSVKSGQVGVSVNFSNMPKGTRVETDDKMNYLNSLSLGYSMGGGL